jgi:hypothetical protein
MDYKKIELQEPIDEIQEGETPKQHYFVDLFYDVEDDNIKKFAESFEGLKKGQTWVYERSTEKLLFDPYTPTYLIKLFSCLQAQTRRKAHWANIFESKKEARKKKIIDFMDTFLDDVIDSTSDLKVTENEINHDGSRPHLKAQGKNHISSARKTNWEILKDLGDIEDPAQKHKVEAETSIESQSIDNLLEAFHASKKEWDKHKQQQ